MHGVQFVDSERHCDDSTTAANADAHYNRLPCQPERQP